MKIELELPDWCDERHIYVFAGIEEVAHRKQGKGWQMKVSRCNQCGECCKKLACGHLVYYANEYRCDYLIDRPFSCCVADNAECDYCNIEWEEVK